MYRHRTQDLISRMTLALCTAHMRLANDRLARALKEPERPRDVSPFVAAARMLGGKS